MAAIFPQISARWTASVILRQHCLQAGRDPAQVEVTVLDIPVIGRDRRGCRINRGETARQDRVLPPSPRRHHLKLPTSTSAATGGCWLTAA
jgi:hypothetical protein